MNNRQHIRIALLWRYSLDCDGLASLLRNDIAFDVVARLTEMRNIDRRFQRIRPHVTIVDAKMGHGRTFETVRRLLSKGLTQFVLFVDSEPNRHQAERAFAIDNAGYLTRKQGYSEIRRGVISLVYGHRPIDPTAVRWFGQRRHGRKPPVFQTNRPDMSALSVREHDILRLLAEGNTVDECADIMGIKRSTADNHKCGLMKKVGVRRTTLLVRLAIREGIIDA